VFQSFAKIREKYPHQTLHPGDTIPVKGLKVEMVAGAGDAIASPLSGPGAGQPNPLCASYEALKPDPGENAHSLAIIITFGSLRIADLGDLYWNQEHDLVCPINKLGTVDLYMTTHHGTATSGPPQIVHALHPRVAIMNNGADKGGSIKAWTSIKNSPGLEDLWQLHFSKEGGKDHNVCRNVHRQSVRGQGPGICPRSDCAAGRHNHRPERPQPVREDVSQVDEMSVPPPLLLCAFLITVNVYGGLIDNATL
jgi:competence protein ComEC